MPTLVETYTPIDQEMWGTSNWDLGSKFENQDSGIATFAVFSARATRVLLEIYDEATGKDAIASFLMVKNNDNIWRCKIDGVNNKTFYAFRCWGPNWQWHENWKRGNSNLGFISDVDNFGNRFNPNKVLFDPYAIEISHAKETRYMLDNSENGSMYGTGNGLYKGIPHIDLTLLKEIREKVDIPLVMHGGSGLVDEEYRKVVAAGIAKINIFTSIHTVATQKMMDVAKMENPNMFLFCKQIKDAYVEVCKHFFDLFSTYRWVDNKRGE